MEAQWNIKHMTSKLQLNSSTTELCDCFLWCCIFLRMVCTVFRSCNIERRGLGQRYFLLSCFCLFSLFLLYYHVFTKYSTVTTLFNPRNFLRRAPLSGSVFFVWFMDSKIADKASALKVTFQKCQELIHVTTVSRAVMSSSHFLATHTAYYISCSVFTPQKSMWSWLLVKGLSPVMFAVAWIMAISEERSLSVASTEC